MDHGSPTKSNKGLYLTAAIVLAAASVFGLPRWLTKRELAQRKAAADQEAAEQTEEALRQRENERRHEEAHLAGVRRRAAEPYLPECLQVAKQAIDQLGHCVIYGQFGTGSRAAFCWGVLSSRFNFDSGESWRQHFRLERQGDAVTGTVVVCSIK